MGIYGKMKEQITDAIRARGLVASIVGFGYVGLCLGLLLAERKVRVHGIDVRKSVVDMTNRGVSHVVEPEIPEALQRAVAEGLITATTDYSPIKDSDVVLVTVGTPLADDGTPRMDDVRDAAKQIGKFLQKGQMIILKSTVMPGVTEEVFLPAIERESGLKAGIDFGLAFCPERLAEGKALKEIKLLPIVVGGIDAASSACAAAFWEALGLETITVSSAKTAEMTKLADNLWIDLNIALANELAMLCEKVGVDVLEVVRSANTLPKGQNKVNILIPGSGVGGSCLVKDPWFVHKLAKGYGLDMIMPRVSREVNDRMPAHMVKLTEDALKAAGKELSGSKVAVLGYAFNSATNDTRSTPSKPYLEMLKGRAAGIKVFDKWVDQKEIAGIGLQAAATLEEAVSGADCIVIITGHPEFRQMDLGKVKHLAAKGCAVVDGRHVIDPAAAIAAGFIYRGVGRGRWAK